MIKDCIEDQMLVTRSLHTRAKTEDGRLNSFNNHHSSCPTVEEVETVSDIFYGKPQPTITPHGSLQLHS